jgi:hypothetical protein
MKPISFPDAKEALDQVLNAEPRSAVLVGASFLEFTLEMAIRSRLRPPKSETESRRLFSEQDGIFSNFHRKIWAAYYLNLIGPLTRSDCDTVRQIRNECAHSTGAISFETSALHDRCRSFDLLKRIKASNATTWRNTHLRLVKPAKTPSGRSGYFVTVGWIAAGLTAKAAATAEEQAANNPFKEFLDLVVNP